MRDVSKILKLTIADAGFTTTTRNNLVVDIVRLTSDIKLGYGFSEWEAKKDLATKLTIGDALDAYTEGHRAALLNSRSPWPLPAELIKRTVSNAFVALGLTRLECLALPSSTVTDEMLCELDKEVLLEKSILVLGTISRIALRSLQNHFGRSATGITIRSLLGISQKKWICRGSDDFQFSVNATRSRVLRIGLGREDGIFLAEQKRTVQRSSLPMAPGQIEGHPS